MNSCAKCKKYGLEFNRNYKPTEFIEGKTNSKVWIIGLNPAADNDWKDESRNVNNLANWYADSDSKHPYFKNFERVSTTLYKMFGKEEGVAHTDLVKCSSRNWPPDSCNGNDAEHIIENCKDYLIEQINLYKPKMIICNGAPVSRQIQNILKSIRHISDTAYESKIDDTSIIVVLSGFIGRIDNYSRRRLGYEIEKLLLVV